MCSTPSPVRGTATLISLLAATVTAVALPGHAGALRAVLAAVMFASI